MSPTEDSQKGGGEAGVIYGVLEGKGGRGEGVPGYSQNYRC